MNWKCICCSNLNLPSDSVCSVCYAANIPSIPKKKELKIVDRLAIGSKRKRSMFYAKQFGKYKFVKLCEYLEYLEQESRLNYLNKLLSMDPVKRKASLDKVFELDEDLDEIESNLWQK